MSGGWEIEIAMLEESLKDLRFELRDADWSLEEIAHGVRPKSERRAILVKRRKVETVIERTEQELKRLASQNGVFCDKSPGGKA